HHEVPELAVRVEELHVGFDDVRRRQAVARLEGALDGAPCLQVAEAHAIESLALARLHELVLDDDAGIAVEDDLEAGAEFAGAVVRHRKRPVRGAPGAAYHTGCHAGATGRRRPATGPA